MAKTTQEQLREFEATANAETIAKVLKKTNYRLAKRAAEIAKDISDESLLPALKSAFQRFCTNGQKSDPGCEAKTAIVEALRSMRFDDEDFFIDACGYRQHEPVWGGSVDTAAEVRVLAAFALSETNSRFAMSILVDLLVDPENACRAGAARALAATNQDAAKWLLRLKAHHGDEEPAVLGECLTGLLGISPADGLPIALDYLSSENLDERLEAAIALGTSRISASLEPLQRNFRTAEEREEKRMMLTAIALLESDEAIEFVLTQAESKKVQIVVAAIHALSHVRDKNAIRQRLAPLIQQNKHPDITKAFKEYFE